MSTRSEIVTRVVVDCDFCDRTNIGYRYEIITGARTLHACSPCYHHLTEPKAPLTPKRKG
jgi:hypothetical protein